MAATLNRGSSRASPQAGRRAEARLQRPAAAAAERVWAAGLLLGAAGLMLCGFAIARLFLTWQVGPHAASHHVSFLGRRLAYPVANFEAWFVLALSAVGLVVAARLVSGALRELVAARGFQRWLASQKPTPHNGAWVIQDELPRAFCAGWINPRVYVSSAVVSRLDHAALNALLAHEFHHARRRDPLRLAVGRVLARALFFVPGLGELVRRQQDLAEFGADETAMRSGADSVSGLARAMLAFSEPAPGLAPAGIDPRRVDHLLGAPPSWRFPTLLCVTAAAVLGLVGALAVLVAQVAVGSATLAPPFLSHQPCIVVLALIPGAVGLGCAGVAQRLRSQRSAA